MQPRGQSCLNSVPDLSSPAHVGDDAADLSSRCANARLWTLRPRSAPSSRLRAELRCVSAVGRQNPRQPRIPWTRVVEFNLGMARLPTAGSRPTVALLELSQREFGKWQKPRILDRCNPMAETREILSIGCKRHERLNAVLADQHGEVPSFLGWSDQESIKNVMTTVRHREEPGCGRSEAAEGRAQRCDLP
jgi:hypothetical protein